MPIQVKYNSKEVNHLPDSEAIKTLNEMRFSNVSEELKSEMADYAKELRRNHPMINERTVQKRVAEKFNLKIL